MEIIWRLKPKFNSDSAIFSILNYRANEEEVFYQIRENVINDFINLLDDNRKIIQILNDIRTNLKTTRKHVLRFKPNKTIHKVVFLPNVILVVFEEIDLDEIDKYLLMIYSIFLSKIYHKKSINIKVVVISTKMED